MLAELLALGSPTYYQMAIDWPAVLRHAVFFELNHPSGAQFTSVSAGLSSGLPTLLPALYSQRPADHSGIARSADSIYITPYLGRACRLIDQQPSRQHPG
jgi:hypothetical protein